MAQGPDLFTTGELPAAPEAARIARCFVDVPLRRAFDYRIPEAFADAVQVGTRVLVPFHGRRAVAFVAELPATSEVPLAKLKAIAQVMDEQPVVTPEVLALAQWVSGYYACGPGEALTAAVPYDVAQPKERKPRKATLGLEAIVRLPVDAPPPGKKPGPKQRAVIEALAKAGGSTTLGALLEAAAADRTTVERLRAKGTVSIEEALVPEDEALIDAPEPPPPEPTKEQAAALAPIVADIEARRFTTTLLFGVTGSGKTEVYLRAIARTLELGRSAIVLVPEIALTPQTERRFRARFGERVAVLHSKQGGKERRGEWWRVRTGAARVVVGPRSATWAPVTDLGLVVVDEEHEGSYKQESSPRYHARDVAIIRARAASAPVILGSATPSLESWQNAQDKKYRLLQLRSRPAGASLPRCEVVDRRREFIETRGPRYFSRALELALKEAFSRNERAIIFLNRRGFTTQFHCTRCGHDLKCPHCDIALAFHKRDAKVLCHFCHYQAPVPMGPCPECLGPPLKQSGAGTERIEETFAQLFPDVRAARLDTDALTGGTTAEDVLRRFRQGDARVLIGTQMVAKGLDVPDVTVVGVVSADVGLSLPDFRSSERTFQLVAQVAGRAGRGERPGRTVIQTFNPEHEAIALAARHDFEAFAAHELDARKVLGYPPYTRLLKILWRGADPKRVEAEAEACAQELTEKLVHENAKVLGPAPSPRAYLAGKHRFQALVKAAQPSTIRRVMAMIEARERDKSVEVVLDVDPVQLL